MSGTNGAANLQNAFFATPKQHATEGPPKTCCPGAWRPFWILVKTKRVQLLGLLGLLLLLVLLLEVVLQASKTHPSPHRNTMLLKDGTTSKNMLPRGLTSLLDSGKKKRLQLLGLLLLLLELVIAAAGPAAAAPAAAPAAAAGGAAGAGAASLQNAPFATPKHHATEGRNDLQKHVVLGLDVPSGFW